MNERSRNVLSLGKPPKRQIEGFFVEFEQTFSFEMTESKVTSTGEVVPPYVEALNARQREAVMITEGPLMVLAGAGSGKTKMLTSRIAYLMDVRGVAPYRILAVTFTNKAAQEMRERVQRTIGTEWSHSYWLSNHGPEIGTFHSVCVRILRKELAHTPFTAPFVIYDDSDQLSLVKDAMRRLGIDEKAFNPKSFQGAINRLKCDALEPQDIQPETHQIFERQLKRVYEQYQKELFANNALDFGEILTLTYRMFRDQPELRRRYQDRFQYIHVDEYQDTNRAQYLLLCMLAQRAHGGNENICVVGDEDQSIYKWRGADIRNILEFERDYPGAQVVKLEQNYRSTQTIIEAASEVIRNNRQRKEKTLWTDNVVGPPLERVQLADERAEAEFVIGEIKRLASQDERSFDEFAIFYRTNAQSRQFEDVLRKDRIPYQIVGGLRFYDRKEIKDVLSYLKVIFNPGDSVSLKRIINTPARGIGKTTLEAIETVQREALLGGTSLSYWDACIRVASDSSLSSPSASKKVGAFVTAMQRWMDARSRIYLTELYHLILDETGYVRELKAEDTDEAAARVENLEELDSLLQEFEEDWAQRTPETERDARKGELLNLFVEQAALASDVASNEVPESAVKLMTLHSSKGLEFPVVFLVGMEEGLFPSVKPWDEGEAEDIEEERRLCYVGITRARELLFMTHVTIRRLWGNVNYQDPSRFFQEIPERLMVSRDLSVGARAQMFRPGSSRQLSDHSTRGFTGAIPQSKVVGRRVLHPEYGPGRVISSDGSGEDEKVTIEFSKSRQTRKFVLRYVASFFED